MEQIWWEKVPNALSFVSDVTESLIHEKSLVLYSSVQIPWHNYMVSYIQDAVARQNASKRFEVVRGVEDPGPYLLKTFCKQEKRAQYRPAKGYSSFFAENDDIVLHARYIWVTIQSPAGLENWLQFVSSYTQARGKSKERAAFVLEWQGDRAPAPKKGLTTYSLDEYISNYDRRVFAMLASSAVKMQIFWKNYLSELVANLAGNDMELCAACLNRSQELLKDPKSVLLAISDEEFRSNGQGYDSTLDSGAIDHLIWLTQIKTVYPLLEEFREAFVLAHAKDIGRALPISTSFGETYTDPKDVELGTLVFMVGNGYILLNPQEYSKLCSYRDARNRLSHLSVLSYEEIQKLLQ